ncbi:MAG: exo-alpha-sialidase [Planctomycetes bacterium]|nr:exo-alpha-sialidase [Planctomycetota bacterium]
MIKKLIPLLLLVVTAVLAGEPMKKDMVLYRHEGRYSAFPSLFKGEGDQLWVGFGWNTTRSHYGKAAGGERGSISLYSPDGGETWLRKGKDEGYKDRPAQLASLTCRDGTRVSIGPIMHEVLPGEKKNELVQRGIAVKEWKAGHISASYRVRMYRTLPGEKRATKTIVKLPHFASMGGFGFGVVLPDDTILKPVYGLKAIDDPATRSWVLRSTNKGKTWDLIDTAYNGVNGFNESDLLALPGGRILCMIRAYGGKQTDVQPREQGWLWQSHSDDGGKTWTGLHRTDIWGYPPTLLLLENGDILCSYGYRRGPFGIRACFSHDGGKTWDVENEIILRADALPDGPGRGKGSIGDLGYPRSVQLSDGTIFTVYYITLGDGVTHIAATKWSLDYRGPADLARGPAAIPGPDPSLPPELITGEGNTVELRYGLMQTFIPVKPQIKMIAVRISKESLRPDLTHTHGLRVVVRKPNEKTWWTKFLSESGTLKPDEVKAGWNAFVFKKPVEVTPGETYAFTLYNNDFIGGKETRLKDGLTGDHRWYVNGGKPFGSHNYPNGSRDPQVEQDLAFKVYAEEGPLPTDPVE